MPRSLCRESQVWYDHSALQSDSDRKARGMGRQYYDQIQVGDEYTSPGVTVTNYHVMAFAGLSMDFFELHTNEEFARQTQFGRRVVHGLLGLALADGLKNRSDFQVHA